MDLGRDIFHSGLHAHWHSICTSSHYETEIHSMLFRIGLFAIASFHEVGFAGHSMFEAMNCCQQEYRTVQGRRSGDWNDGSNRNLTFSSLSTFSVFVWMMMD